MADHYVKLAEADVTGVGTLPRNPAVTEDVRDIDGPADLLKTGKGRTHGRTTAQVSTIMTAIIITDRRYDHLGKPGRCNSKLTLPPINYTNEH